MCNFSEIFILMIKCDIKIYATNWDTYKTSFKGDFVALRGEEKVQKGDREALSL